MRVNKKVTDFIKLENGNIGRKAAVVTGALLASTVVGAMLTTQVAEAHCDAIHGHHWNWFQHTNHGHIDIPQCE